MPMKIHIFIGSRNFHKRLTPCQINGIIYIVPHNNALILMQADDKGLQGKEAGRCRKARLN